MLPVELYRDLVRESRKDTRQLAYLLEKHKLIPSSKAWRRNWETLCVAVGVSQLGVLRPSPLQLPAPISRVALALARTRSPARPPGGTPISGPATPTGSARSSSAREPGARPVACEHGARRPDVLSR